MEGSTYYFDWEVALIQWIQERLGTVGTAIAEFFSMFGDEMILIAVLGLLYWCLDKKSGKFVGTSLAAGIVWNPMIKNVFIRRRPYFDNPGIECLRPVEADADLYDIAAQGYSFPSGHSTSSVSVFSAIPVVKKNKALTVIGIVLPLLVGISKFSLGVHYPTDVLVGWALGAAVILAVYLMQRAFKDVRLMYLLLTLIGIPGWFYCASDDFYTGFGLMIGMFTGFMFEEKFVDFENTKNIIRCVLRILGGVVIFLGLNTLLKLPFSDELLDSGTFLAHFIRAARYAVVSFIDIGVYPMLFAVTAKIGANKAE